MIVNDIQKLNDSGDLKRFLKAGIISIKVKAYYDIYGHYLSELEANKDCKDCKMQSISNTGLVFGVCDVTVYKAIKTMTSE